MDRPLDKQTVDNICIANGLRNAKELGAASIRQFVSVVKDIEAKTGVEYIRMEIGEPGLPAEMIGIEAEHEALLRRRFKVPSYHRYRATYKGGIALYQGIYQH